MPFSKSTKTYVRWDERKKLKAERYKKSVPVEDKPAKPTTTPKLCEWCHVVIPKKQRFCGRSCASKYGNKLNRDWESQISKRLQEQGWNIFYPDACCDRIGIRNGQLAFFEFKPKGRTQLRKYQRLVQKAMPHVYQVIVGTEASSVTSGVEILSVKQKPRMRRELVGRGKSRFMGVHWDRGWKARIHVASKRIYLGVYNTEEEAAAAYRRARKLYFGDSDQEEKFED